MAEEIGRVLDGRYRIIAPIGRGASAQVFLADDVRLRRRVAVKMLHAALADDADFLRRFQAEAQAAAALNHPHVMAVYDWGQDPEHDIPYLILEYLGGGSLRAMLDQGTRLTLSQALLVGLEATRALEYAHQRGFVHRDIKPANLVFGDEGRLRIADFGLARALAEAAWTEPQGAVLGTARYASPEQAQGQPLTGKADVYSLALVLVEAVTGSVPFAADTTLGTLMARVGKPLVVPAELGPLRSALERAGRPDPDERLDAHQFAIALMAAAEELPKPEPFPLAGAIHGAEPGLDADPTMLGTAADAERARRDLGGAATATRSVTDVGEDGDLDVPAFVTAGPGPGVRAGSPTWPADIEDSEAAEVGAQGEGGGPDEVGRPEADHDADLTGLIDLTDRPTGAERSASVAAEPVGWSDPDPVDPTMVALRPPTSRVPFDDAEPYPQEPAPEGRLSRRERKARAAAAGRDGDAGGRPTRRRWPRRTFILVLLVAGALAAATLVVDLTRTASHPVPVVKGLDLKVAQARLARVHLKVTVTHTRVDGTTAGTVLSIAPPSGVKLAEGQRVRLVVSDGNTFVDVPVDLNGKARLVAAKELTQRGLKVGVADAYSETVARDFVVAPAIGTPSRLVKGSTVVLVVSQGPKPRVIPNGLPGQSADAVRAALQNLQLRSTTTQAYDETVKAGQVISTAPAGGATAARGSVVSIVVSQGPKPVTVPDVSRARTPQGAAALLEAAGLTPGNVSGPLLGTPAASRPAAGAQVPRGTTVDIILRG